MCSCTYVNTHALIDAMKAANLNAGREKREGHCSLFREDFCEESLFVDFTTEMYFRGLEYNVLNAYILFPLREMLHGGLLICMTMNFKTPQSAN